MGSCKEEESIVLLFDNYLLDSQKLHTSFKQAGKRYPVAVIADDGFLPDDVISVYGYFLGEFKAGKDIPGKPRYFNQITVPKYWEISGTNSSGKICELNKERGRIFYADPAHKRFVEIVDWLDETGVVRYSDHYNKQGALYARTIFNAEGKKVNKSYFSADGKEVIVENFVTKDIILNEDNAVKIFHSLTDFVCYFMKKKGFDKRRIFFNTLSTSFFVSQKLDGNTQDDVLFWQENVYDEIPGNMRIILNGSAARTSKIMVQQRGVYEKLVELGAPAEYLHRLGYCYAFAKENTGRPRALICTNSDQIAHLEKLVESLPKLEFHIAAITEMSSKLMGMERYENVTVYPGIRQEIAEELFQTCDVYLDINYGGEILDAVQRAFLHNHLIYAFKETMHNPKYVADVHIYPLEDAEQMIEAIRRMFANAGSMKRHIQIQHRDAMLESDAAYTDI